MRLRRRHGAPVVGTDVALVSPEEMALSQAAGSEPPTQGPPTCGGQAVPEGWPDYSSWLDEELLAPFLKCTSPSEFLELQRRVDMPRLVEALEDWSAVRLGALGPLETPAAEVLQRKRFSFLVTATEKYGAYDQVLTLFLVDTTFDDEVRDLLLRLARDKQLEQTLGRMEAVREKLERRGLKLSDYPDRDEQLSDVLRGLGRAANDVRSTIPLRDGLQGGAVYATRAHLPPPYQEAFDETERALVREHFSPGHVTLGTLDHMTFGVPLGFYYLAAGTGHGVHTLTQGQYEQATRELAPAALLVGLYAGGKGLRFFSGAKGVAGVGAEGERLPVPELRVQMLREVVERLRARLSESDFAQLVRWLRGSREVGVLVATHGEPFAMVLVEARGDPVKAQAVFSQTRPEPRGPAQTMAGAGKNLDRAASMAEEAPGPSPKMPGAGNTLGSLASLVNESVGHTAEVVHARLARAELLEAPGARLPANVAWLEQNRPGLEAPPPGVPEGSALWHEYVAYREGRLSELKAGEKAKGPLRWEEYEQLRGLFARGLAFERIMVALLRADAALPQAQRLWLRDFVDPRIETCVGVAKEGQPGVRFADVLVIERQPPAGQPPRVETFSFKSRDLSLLKEGALTAQMTEDAREALGYYGETLNIRRPSLKYLGSEVQVRRVRLIYEGGELKPTDPALLKKAVPEVQREVKGVEVLVK
ncbi:hypothetical protein [Hyalangium versicolor]|uniref:hypothetical protein n=1 Tax=Hyalangium versicolor TaxID=2861190 RepID=UPI001CCD2BD3|nr:hypothetical protein [Hyalangium versicolor]